MAKWEVFYYPPSGDRRSPNDILIEICSKKEIADIVEKLRVVSELSIEDWPRWVKQVNGLFQLTHGNFRMYFQTQGRKIIICHMCRKVSQKAKESDIYRAKQNWKDYMENGL